MEVLPMSGVVCLYSGGLDSTALLYWCRAEYERVHALAFDYGQLHRNELSAAARIANLLGIGLEILTVKAFMEIGNAQLVRAGDSAFRDSPLTAASAVVPGRNLVFLTLAAAVARRIGWGTVAIGCTGADSPAFPDCGEPFMASAKTTLAAAGVPVRIERPFATMTKADVVRIGRNLGMSPEIERETVSCYQGVRGTGCGRCHACAVRAEAMGTCL